MDKTEPPSPADRGSGSNDLLGQGSEARNETVLGLNDVDKQNDLILRLQDEADLCRNDGAGDIAALLDEAVQAIRDRNHDTQVGEKWREDSRLETWFPLTAEELERLRTALRKIEASEYIHLPTMVREALGPNVTLNGRPEAKL